MNKLGKIIVGVVTAGAIIGASLGVHFGYNDTKFEQREYTVNANSDNLRVAVISDLQLPNSDSKDTHEYESFEKTLRSLKDRGMDVLIIAGDFTDCSTRKAWGTYKEIYDKVMSETGDNEPVKLYIMGNHDYWLPYFFECFEIPSSAKLQKRYEKYTGQPVNSHTVINGYHFICWSSQDGTYDKSYQNKDEVRAEIEKAIQDDFNKPVFVMTHLNPQDTAYGSDEWGNEDIDDVLKDYPQVISISGHSHYSIIDERSLWQDKYTAFTTQSLDYIELETGKFNGSVPVDAYGNSLADKVPACLYMTIEEGKVTIERLEANTGKAIKEPWVIEAPFTDLDKYSSKRADSNTAPVLDNDLNVSISDIEDKNKKAQKMISFKAGSDDDFVHSYRLRFYDENQKLLSFKETDYDGNINRYDNEGNKVAKDSEDYDTASEKDINELLYFSDFVLGLDNMSDTAELRLPSTMPQEAKYVGITAIDSWNAQSDEIICSLE